MIPNSTMNKCTTDFEWIQVQHAKDHLLDLENTEALEPPLEAESIPLNDFDLKLVVDWQKTH